MKGPPGEVEHPDHHSLKQLLLTLRRHAPWRTLARWVAYSERRRLLDAELESLNGVLRGRVLEIGSGQMSRRGRFKPPFEQTELWLTLDLESTNRPHIRGDVLALPVPTGYFDAILCLEVLEYVGDLQGALTELRRVLKPERGVLLLSLPFMHRADHPQDTWRLTRQGVQWALSKSGFIVENIFAQGAALVVVANVLKFVIYLVVRERLWCLPIAGLAWLPIMLLRWLDEPLAQRIEHLRDYSTGYLVLARPARHKDARL